MIGISTIEADVNGAVIISGVHDFLGLTARVSRTKTLDGGVHITHSGISDGDRTLTVQARVNRAQEETIRHIFKNHTFVHVSTPEGFFIAAIRQIRIDRGNVRMEIYINNKENH